MKLKTTFILLIAVSLACVNRSTRREAKVMEKELEAAMEEMADSLEAALEAVSDSLDIAADIWNKEQDILELENEFRDIYARFDTLISDYNTHLADKHSKGDSKGAFKSDCNEAEAFRRMHADASPEVQLGVIDNWIRGFYRCYNSFLWEMYHHLSFFHAESSIYIPEDAEEILDALYEYECSWEGEVSRIKDGLKASSENVEGLRTDFENHMKDYH
ncbi:hypothetical protein GF359_02825 [candidate division WOR-3 bacterium]|uniref:Uncharacterized protein n=1 Tax=candidate division WOR-3 bacterium TaxID=2052148 RepID=A0A9D5K8B4_UNCW3|nr:hypothetical protein [candidate division WOR-3 bacterium]MBD3364127.1 hypothetical protein [candidate division WOR-3 bacterium]